jgi:glucokinase-like ROK family protein
MNLRRSTDHTVMREMNTSLILECLHSDAPLSRSALAKRTGLNKATVTSVIKKLIESGFVKETDSGSGELGRPSIPLILDPDAGCILGAEIGVDFISVILTNFAVKILWRRKVSISPAMGQSTVIEMLIDLLNEANAYAGSRKLMVLGLGLGVPGLMDIDKGILLFAPNLMWTNVPLNEILQKKFSFPIYVDNEANMAALGESIFGAARGSDLVLYLSSGVGLGGGIVLNRKIYSGAAGLAGEIGHMTIDPDGPLCNCGNSGCWETFVSQWAVFRRIQQAVLGGSASCLSEKVGNVWDRLTFPMVVEAAQEGDVVAHNALEDVGKYLGIGISNLINAFNPQKIVLGGMLSLGKEILLPVIREVVSHRSLRWAREVMDIEVATYGEDSCVIGGVASVYYHILSQPLVANRAG